MGWSDSPLRTLTLPQDAGSSDPRIVIGPDLPTALTGATTDFTWTAAIIFWFNATDFKFEAIGWYNLPNPQTYPVWAEGTYDTVHGFHLNALEVGPATVAAVVTMTYGSDAYNSTEMEWRYRHGLINLTDTSQLALPASPLIAGRQGGYVSRGYVVGGLAASSAGPEVAIPAGTWDVEPEVTWLDNHVYVVEVQWGFGETGAIQIAPIVRLRKGSASIAGQILGGTVIQPVPSALAFHAGTPFTAYVANLSGADITSRLSLTISGGVAGNNARLYGTTAPGPQLCITVREVGLAVDPFANITTHELLNLCELIV